jgi:tetratricopeptide (TPR) repeat protein
VNKGLLDEFLSLPINASETWQGGGVPMEDVLANSPPDMADLFMVVWRSASTDLVHAQPVGAGESCLDGLMEVMLEFSSMHEFPCRPARIECNDRELAGELSDVLHGSRTTVTFAPEMPEWETLVEELTEHLGSVGPPLASLIDAGCSETQVREFAAAAAAFYQAGLWNYLDDVDLIKIETPRAPRHLKHAVVLGAASQTYGLGFYDDAEIHYDIAARRVAATEVSLSSLTFETVADICSADVDVWQELDLPLATGDAFPSFNFFSEEGPRRPTPRELEFATIVLHALAATSEQEIDTGRWSKEVECFGKTKMAGLSIANLLDPPDRQEWIRRGMMPEGRGHERHFKMVQDFIEQHGEEMSLDELNAEINARFNGPMDDFEHPLETPADRAEALCQQAIDTFGRRRIQLVHLALAEDATHVEANVLLAEWTPCGERRVELFRNAKEMATDQLGSMMDEQVGHFWGITETRPFMRATHGLADALYEAGQTGEAIVQYQELLRLNPNDNQGVRFQLAPLLLANNRDAEAVELLDSYREPTALWRHTKSVVEFRRRHRSAAAKKEIRAAFRANGHLIELLESSAPPMFSDSYAPGSPEEAAICIQELSEAWDETEGYFEWMLGEYFLWETEREKKGRDRKRKQQKNAGKKTGKKRQRR